MCVNLLDIGLIVAVAYAAWHAYQYFGEKSAARAVEWIGIFMMFVFPAICLALVLLKG